VGLSLQKTLSMPLFLPPTAFLRDHNNPTTTRTKNTLNLFPRQAALASAVEIPVAVAAEIPPFLACRHPPLLHCPMPDR
jgi:hypothetical protein